jgi:two-component sensor histidine kinase
MTKAAVAILLLSVALSTEAQPQSTAFEVLHYSADQKRLLLVNTFQFINFVAQNNLDQDSALSIACSVTGIPFSMPYDDSAVAGDARRIRSLLQIGMQFLHRPGTYKTDLDSSYRSIADALTLSVNGKYKKWENECHFLEGEVYAQRGDTQKSSQIYLGLALNGQETHDTLLMARAYQHMGTLLVTGDSMKLAYYKRSLELYQQKSIKEKEIELLWSVAFCHYPLNLDLVDSAMKQILLLQQSTSFKHCLYAKYVLSYVYLLKANYVDAVTYGKSAFENMQWSGFSPLSASFFMRVGAAYEGLGEVEEALSWFKKALATRSRTTHLFWYKSLIFATELLADVNKPRKSLEMINSVTTDYPPISTWENLQVLSIKGKCYEMLNEPNSADQYYTALYAMVTKFPSADPYTELLSTFYKIGGFYVSQGNLKKANQFLQLAELSNTKQVYANYDQYKLLFKIDSAEGNYRSAMHDHILYKYYADSITNRDQQKKMGELTLAYTTAKKDKDIALLRQQGIIQQAELKQNRLFRNIMVAGFAALSLIAGLLFSQFKSKQRANLMINKKNTQLQHLIDEKEWLLKEVHHRVKNNLHTVICLLESQARHLENDALKAIEVSQQRIYAMSLIHQQLYQSEDIKVIDMSSYIPELVRYLKTSFGVTDKIRFQLEIDQVKLDVAQAIPVGLIINEAVTNSIKYAFPSGQEGMVSISMIQKTDTISLIIADSGIGMNPANAATDSSSLGIKLVKGLIEDLNGQIQFDNSYGTIVKIAFPADRIMDPTPASFAINNDR